MGTIPTWPTITTGQYVTSTVMNQYRDAGNFWARTPRCYAYESTAQTTTTGTWLLVALASEIYDIVQSGDSPSHDNTTNNSRIYIRTTGIYEITGQAQFVANSSGARQATIRLNSGGVSTGGTIIIQNTQSNAGTLTTSVSMTTVEASLTAGDYLEMFAWQNSGGNLDTLAGYSATFMRMKLTGSP